LQSKTGLSLSYGTDGKMSYLKDESGNPIIATTIDASGNVVQMGSETARNQLIKIIDAPETINTGINRNPTSAGSKGGGNQIWLDPNQINAFISGTFGVDNTTLGWAMTYLHETYHTIIGGGLKDNNFLFINHNPLGEVVPQMNIIRAELNAQGGNYGQRMSYVAYPIYGNTYMPFCQPSLQSVTNGVMPMFFHYFIRF